MHSLEHLPLDRAIKWQLLIERNMIRHCISISDARYVNVEIALSVFKTSYRK